MVLALLQRMPSVPRRALLENGSICHVTWQCHNKSWLLKQRWAKELYYQLLLKYKDRYGMQIYSYCLMDNHIHLSGQLGELEDFSDFFRVVNSSFAKAYNNFTSVLECIFGVSYSILVSLLGRLQSSGNGEVGEEGVYPRRPSLRT